MSVFAVYDNLKPQQWAADSGLSGSIALHEKPAGESPFVLVIGGIVQWLIDNS